MFRPGRFALRVLVVTAVSFAVLAPASFGQAASLSTESLESNPAFGAGQETSFGAFTCDKDGTTTIPFQTQGSAFGPYVGTFTETGTVTIGPQTDTSIDTRGVGAILDFEATFTIDSQFPVGTVTGTKQLSPTAPTEPSLAGGFGSCDPDGSSPPNDVVAIVTNPNILYQAQINATTGSRSDSGTSSMVIRSIAPPLTATFQETFISTEPETCEDGNNGNGNGDGQDKKKNDNDDDEVC